MKLEVRKEVYIFRNSRNCNFISIHTSMLELLERIIHKYITHYLKEGGNYAYLNCLSINKSKSAIK